MHFERVSVSRSDSRVSFCLHPSGGFRCKNCVFPLICSSDFNKDTSNTEKFCTEWNLTECGEFKTETQGNLNRTSVCTGPDQNDWTLLQLTVSECHQYLDRQGFGLTSLGWSGTGPASCSSPARCWCCCWSGSAAGTAGWTCCCCSLRRTGPASWWETALQPLSSRQTAGRVMADPGPDWTELQLPESGETQLTFTHRRHTTKPCFKLASR